MRIWKNPLAIALAVLALAPDLAAADEFNGEEVLFADVPSVFSASKYEQKVTEAPSAVSVVTSEEIAANGYRTIGEILASLAGVFTTNDLNYTYLAVRGFGRPGDFNTRVLFLLDGVRINENVYGASGIGQEFIVDVALIERIEFVRGPSSSLYGTGAFFGVVNVITKRGRNYETVDASQVLGQNATRDTRITGGKRSLRGVEALVSGSRFDSDGRRRIYFPEFYAKNDGIAENLDAESQQSGFARLSYRDLSFEFAAVDRRKDVPTASYGTVFNAKSSTRDQYAHAILGYARDITHTFSVRATLHSGWYEYEGHYPYDWADEGEESYVVENLDLANGAWWDGEIQGEKVLGSRHRLVFGTTLENSYRENQSNVDREEPPVVNLDEERSSTLWAVYGQDEFRLASSAVLVAGLRHDHYDRFGGRTSPRLALVLQRGERTTVKALYGQAFRAPNSFELFYQDGGNTAKAPDGLKPESIRTGELVLEQRLAPSFLAAASAYRYEMSNLIDLVTDPNDDLLVFQNGDQVDARGLELSLDGRWPSGWAVRASHAIQRAESVGNSRQLSNSPTHLSRLGFSLPLASIRGTASVEARIMSQRQSVKDLTVTGHAVINATVRARVLLEGLQVSASVYNLFNEVYGDPGIEEHVQNAIEQSGRTARIKVGYSF